MMCAESFVILLSARIENYDESGLLYQQFFITNGHIDNAVLL